MSKAHLLQRFNFAKTYWCSISQNIQLCLWFRILQTLVSVGPENFCIANIRLHCKKILPVKGEGGGDEEQTIHQHEDHDGKMKVNTLRVILKKAFGNSYVWFGKERIWKIILALQCLISQYEAHGKD